MKGIIVCWCLLLCQAIAQTDLQPITSKLIQPASPPAHVLAAMANGTYPQDIFPVAQTTSGPVRGYVASGVQIYAGVPLAAPPVGPLRFRPPQAPTSWTDTRDSFFMGNVCPQLRVYGGLLLGNEDCLYINVYAPDSKPAKPRAVMLWIYGGGFALGDGYEFGMYDGKNLVAARDIVLVTFNYRLGPLGFMALNELRQEDPNGSTGNYGMMDQRMALQWVRDNIANFGGDPKQVTIFGESAGAISVCYHIASPASSNLFAGAIMESGNCEDSGFFQPLDEAISFNTLWAATTGCNVTGTQLLECLRALSVSDIEEGLLAMAEPDWPDSIPGEFHGAVPPMAPVFPWGPAIDGTKIGSLDTPLNLIRSQQFTRVPVILGTNNDEGSIFTFAVPLIVHNATFPVDDASMPIVLGHFFNSSTTEMILELYPKDQFSDNDARLARILRDMFFVCSNRRVARSLSDSGFDVYLYHFTYKLDWVESLLVGDYHAAELFFVFDNAWPPILHSFSINDMFMADVMGTYWTNFAKTGNPNHATVSSSARPRPQLRDYPQWPTYSSSSERNLLMDLPPAVQLDYEEAQCEFWDVVTRVPWTHI